MSVGFLLQTISRRLYSRSVALVNALPNMIEWLLPAWIVVCLIAGFLRIAISPTLPANIQQFADVFLPYGVIALAPALAMRLAFLAFPEMGQSRSLAFHLSPVGNWEKVDPETAKNSEAFGPTGIMASLLIGLLLNVPMRAFEFVLAVPALTSEAPLWGRMIFLAMAGETAAMTFLYTVCFVMAFRAIPLFPRMLAAVWAIDICFQLGTANILAQQPNLPPPVAGPLADLLTGNVTKTLVSIVVWLPYLLLSDRVNLTYRHRIRVSSRG